MPRGEARVEGLKELKRALEKAGEEVMAAVQREIMAGTIDVQGQAKQNLTDNKSVISGRLRNSIAFKIDDDGLGAQVGTDVEYAKPVEYGTFRSRAKPYLFPALEQHSPKIRENLTAAVKATVRAANGQA